MENTVPNPYLEIYRELLKNNFIFRFYDLEIGAENRFHFHILIIILIINEFKLGRAMLP